MRHKRHRSIAEHCLCIRIAYVEVRRQEVYQAITHPAGHPAPLDVLLGVLLLDIFGEGPHIAIFVLDGKLVGIIEGGVHLLHNSYLAL